VRSPSEPGPGFGSLAGLLSGVALGTLSITLLFLGMRAVMAIGGACADGGPFVPVRPCPDGVPLAMTAATFGLFGSVGLIVLFGSRFGGGWGGLALLGWPALFISLGWNFLEFGVRPPGDDGPAWGWLICGVVFVIMGALPLVVGIATVRSVGASSSEAAAAPLARTVAQRMVPRRPGSTGDPRSADDATPAARGDALVGRLERLADLHRRGDLSDDEYAAAKARVLGEPEAAG
jgi:hypothetical protein